MASAWNAGLNGGLEAESPVGCKAGASPWKLKAFCPFSYKKVAKS